MKENKKFNSFWVESKIDKRFFGRIYKQMDNTKPTNSYRNGETISRIEIYFPHTDYNDDHEYKTVLTRFKYEDSEAGRKQRIKKQEIYFFKTLTSARNYADEKIKDY